MSETGFSVHNKHLDLCGHIKKLKIVWCSRKTGFKCGYIRILIYKAFLMLKSSLFQI